MRPRGGGESLEAVQQVQQVARRLGLTLEARLAGGEFGAFRVADGHGRTGVLKVLPHNPGFSLERVRKALELASRLRAVGYPIPEYRDAGAAHGLVYTLQAHCPGAVPERLTGVQARRLLELWRLHGAAAPTAGTWGEYAIRMLRAGEPGGLIDHGAVRAADPRAAALIAEVAAVGARTDATLFRAGDIVHGDFHHRNLLVDAGGRLTAVFDWEGAHPGDARLDLATLAFWTAATGQPCAPWVAGHARDLIEPAARAAMAALIAGSVLTFAADARPGYMDWALAAVERVLAPQWRDPTTRA